MADEYDNAHVPVTGAKSDGTVTISFNLVRSLEWGIEKGDVMVKFMFDCPSKMISSLLRAEDERTDGIKFTVF